jgi:hypothetical protein
MLKAETQMRDFMPQPDVLLAYETALAAPGLRLKPGPMRDHSCHGGYPAGE